MIEELTKDIKVYWRLVSMDPVYTDEMVAQETGYTMEEVAILRDKFLMIYNWFSRNVGINKLYELLYETRYAEEG